jgi:molybdenum cofactor biosynthesis enzyme
MPPIEAVVVGPANVVVDLGLLSEPQRIELEVYVDSLASTGVNLTALWGVGLALLAIGVLVSAVRLRLFRTGTC